MLEEFEMKMFFGKKYFILYSLFLILLGIYMTTNANVTQIKPSATGFVQVTEGKLFYQKFGVGTPIIVLHGGPGLDQNYLLPQMLELTKNHEVIFYDQRGSGKSLATNYNENDINLAQFTDDLEKLRTELKLSKVILLGHSWGCTLALNYAIKYPQNITNLILLNPGAINFAETELFTKALAKKTVSIQDKIAPLFSYETLTKLNKEEIAKVYRILFAKYFYDENKVNALTLNMSKESAIGGSKVLALMIKTSFGQDFNLIPGLKKLQTPTLIISAKQDLMPSEIVQDINAAVLSSKLVIIDKCGHFPFVEQPEKLFLTINNFLK